MGGILTLSICVAATALLFIKGSGAAWFAVVVTIVSFYSLGIMANFKDDHESIPPWAVYVNLASLILGIVLCVIGIMI